MHCKLWQAVLLLLLLAQSCVPAMSADHHGFLDLTRDIAPVGTVEHNGKVLKVYGICDYQFAEPIIMFNKSCPQVKYHHSNSQFEIIFPFHITANTLKQPTRKGATVAMVTITGLEVEVDFDLAGVRVRVKLLKSGQAELRFQCAAFERCHLIRDHLQLDSKMTLEKVRIFAFGNVHGVQAMKFAAVDYDIETNFITCDDWIPFLRRVDNSYSFARSWDEYVRGFGSPDAKHYWMGLEMMHRVTSTGKDCKLRMEAVGSADGALHYAEYDGFSVRGSPNYYLNLDKLLQSNVNLYHDQKKGKYMGLRYDHWHSFSTYDRDNYGKSGSCSKSEGLAGWWFSSMGYGWPCTRVGFTSTPMWLDMASWLSDAVVKTSIKSALMLMKCS